VQARIEHRYRILSESEAGELFREAGLPIPPKLIPVNPATPRWDFDSLTLWYGETVCRHYRRRNAQNQFAVLDAFQNSGWTRSVESPFGLLDRTLRETIDELNSGLAEESPIRFAVDGRKPAWIAPACSG
jgi:hypothetical protein